jgi:hypothetical protein
MSMSMEFLCPTAEVTNTEYITLNWLKHHSHIDLTLNDNKHDVKGACLPQTTTKKSGPKDFPQSIHR